MHLHLLTFHISLGISSFYVINFKYVCQQEKQMTCKYNDLGKKLIFIFGRSLLVKKANNQNIKNEPEKKLHSKRKLIGFHSN